MQMQTINIKHLIIHQSYDRIWVHNYYTENSVEILSTRISIEKNFFIANKIDINPDWEIDDYADIIPKWGDNHGYIVPCDRLYLHARDFADIIIYFTEFGVLDCNFDLIDPYIESVAPDEYKCRFSAKPCNICTRIRNSPECFNCNEYTGYKGFESIWSEQSICGNNIPSCEVRDKFKDENYTFPYFFLLFKEKHMFLKTRVLRLFLKGATLEDP